MRSIDVPIATRGLSSASKLKRLSAGYINAQQHVPLTRTGGAIVAASTATYLVSGLANHVKVNDIVEFGMCETESLGQVVRIEPDRVTVKPFDSSVQLGLAHPVWVRGSLRFAPAGTWKGRVLDALSNPVDGKGPMETGAVSRRSDATTSEPLRRHRVTQPVRTGIKVVDLFTPLCRGQRIGIFSGSGVGKSTLLGMFARSAEFDTVVVALVGERGREVREFIDDNLMHGLSNAVVVVATGDSSPMMRRQAPQTAMMIAEHFRDAGDSVLLVVDSITRYAHALREVALAAGEPPVARGYAPSVFTDLPRLLERAGPGTDGKGSITGIFSVLVDGDNHEEPVADAVRGILDGHIVLDRDIATRGRFPAVDVLRSVSRLADKSWTQEQRQYAIKLKAMIGEFENSRELRQLGAYKPGNSPELDRAMAVVPRLYQFLAQSADSIDSVDVFQQLAIAV